LFDYLNNKVNHSPKPHSVELKDALFIAAGGLIAAASLYILTK